LRLRLKASVGVGAAVPRPRRAHNGFEVGKARVPAELASAQRGVGNELSRVAFPPQPNRSPQIFSSLARDRREDLLTE